MITPATVAFNLICGKAVFYFLLKEQLKFSSLTQYAD
jgi:hypothetical protein